MKVSIKILVVLSFLIEISYAQEIKRTRKFYSAGQLEKEQYDTLTKQILLNPNKAELYSKRSEIVYQSNVGKTNNEFLIASNADALRDIRKAIELEPAKANYYKILSDYYFQIDDNIELAIETVTKSVQLEPSNPAWLNRRGFLQKRVGKDKEACEDWTKGSLLTGPDAEKCKNFRELYCR